MMKKYIQYSSIFGLAILIVAIGLDCFISGRLYHNTNRLYRSWNQVYLDTTKYDVIVNGNSRARRMYDPIALDTILGCNSYSLGLDGSGINRQIIRYNKYVELHSYPKLLIQNIDFVSLELTMGVDREQFFPYFIYDRDLISSIDEYEHFSWAEKYIPCYRYLGYEDVLSEAFFCTNAKRIYEYIEKGFCPDNKSWNGDDFWILESYKCSYSRDIVTKFREFIANQKAHGVEVVFVYAPIYHEFWNKVVDLDSVYQNYDALATEYQIPILNYSDIDISQDTSNFYNAIHLNAIGTEKFSHRLAIDLDSLQLVSFK